MNRLEQFAYKQNLRLKKDDCGDLMIPAKLGHIYEHSDLLLGVVLSESPKYSRKKLLPRRRQLVKAGFKLHQAGDAESILLFDPQDVTKAKAVIRALGAKKKRRQTTRQLQNLKKGPEKRALQVPRIDEVAKDGLPGLSQHQETSISSVPTS
jgi:hypothetical protein